MKPTTLDLDCDGGPASAPPRVRSRRRLVFKFVLGSTLLIGLVVFFARSIERAREAARRAQCVCNFCQITLALLNYHDVHGSFPPARVDDAHGRPMHSWRVLILPYLEQAPLYQAYNLNEPWNAPGNLALLGRMPRTFACPSRGDASGAGTSLTSYVLMTGPGTAFPDGATTRTGDIKDGTSRTMIAAEVANIAIPWTEPRDLDVRRMSFRVNDPWRPGISSRHPGGANASYADGGKFFLKDATTPGEILSLVTIAGGESPPSRNATEGR